MILHVNSKIPFAADGSNCLLTQNTRISDLKDIGALRLNAYSIVHFLLRKKTIEIFARLNDRIVVEGRPRGVCFTHHKTRCSYQIRANQRL